MTKPTLPLSMAQTGSRLRIAAIAGGHSLVRKITEMGLKTGTEIEIRQQERGSVVVCRGQTRFAIGVGMAHRIMVEII
ncbi:MAG: ferrous iron transport protein A [Burkholderiaceae bacterium]|nr:ferrous iron transport protein A [Burkholderiaceae bacterium]MCD8537060.1 ferrous iron transport protein A [Burkholderiaceae bacterium]MCD8564472.1 ferrous iron transport protein A [Burkholderiaceae bacterium]